MPIKNRIVWSPTRGRLLDRCTRRYVLEHVIEHYGTDSARLSKTRPLKDHARRALRDAILDLLEAWSMHEERTELESRGVIHRSLLQSIVSGHALESEPHDLVDGLVELMLHRLMAIRKAPLIGRLKREVGNWQSVDRLQPLLLDGARQYGSPDLIFWNGDRLTLVRLTMETRSRVPDEVGILEAGSMLLWAQRNPLIEIGLEQMDVVRVGWLGTRWVKWSKHGSQNWAGQSRSLIAMDIEQMARLLAFDDDVDRLPISDVNWICSGCPFKEDCPKF